MTRAVSGLSGLAIQFARASLLPVVMPFDLEKVRLARDENGRKTWANFGPRPTGPSANQQMSGGDFGGPFVKKISPRGKSGVASQNALGFAVRIDHRLRGFPGRARSKVSAMAHTLPPPPRPVWIAPNQVKNGFLLRLRRRPVAVYASRRAGPIPYNLSQADLADKDRHHAVIIEHGQRVELVIVATGSPG